MVWIPTALGILAAGAWLVPLNTRFRGDEAAYVLEKGDVGMAFIVDSFLGTDYRAMLHEAAPGRRALKDTVMLPGPGRFDGSGWDEFLARGRHVPAATFAVTAS